MRGPVGVRTAEGCEQDTNPDGRRAGALDRCSAVVLHKPGPADVTLPVWTTTSRLSADAGLLHQPGIP